jgi:hypothetical protein
MSDFEQLLDDVLTAHRLMEAEAECCTAPGLWEEYVSDYTANRQAVVDHVEAQATRITELEAYADRLAAGLPEGMLPKDVENLREANAWMATCIQEIEWKLYVAACGEEALGVAVNVLMKEKIAAEKRIAELEAALRSIAENTDADDPESYRADDREGCLDTVNGVANAALAGQYQRLGEEPTQ